jgi:hypothetical protein
MFISLLKICHNSLIDFLIYSLIIVIITAFDSRYNFAKFYFNSYYRLINLI